MPEIRPTFSTIRFFATVAIALTIGPAFFGQQRSASELHARINSIPTGANVKVDGADVGTTPLEIELPCCFHDVKAPATMRCIKSHGLIQLNL